MDKKFLGLVVSLIGLNVVDLIQTKTALVAQTCVELNPIANALNNDGLLIIGKIALVGFAVALFLYAYHLNKGIATKGLAIVVIFYLFLVCWNFLQGGI
jgi:hypothetical protein